MNQVHCWYSETDNINRGHSIYVVDGKECKVTNATHVKDDGNPYNAADSVYLGIGTFVRTVHHPIDKIFDKIFDHMELDDYERCKKALSLLHKLGNQHHYN